MSLGKHSGKSLKLFRTLWGVPFPDKSTQWTSFLKSEVIDKGFEGIECCSPGPFFSFASDPSALKLVLQESNCKIIFQAHTTDYPVMTSSWAEHAASLRQKLEQIVALGVSPEVVNVHAGKDSMSTGDIVEFLKAARKSESEVLHQAAVYSPHLSASSSSLMPCLAFETHRQRMFHSPFQLLDVFKQLPESERAWLKLNADLSHFIVSLERFPTAELDAEFWPHTLRILEDHCVYIHARACSPQAIQIATFPNSSDDADDDTKAMASWWKRIVEGMRRRNVEVRVCPEYGPPPYQPVDAVTGKPVGDLDALVLEGARRLRAQL
ncbi:Hypothetical protein, putative [Bodo saltans]|uniref:Xylose isomerase-like TIM barrel domain-containing protein n=1 Tax=Bodo saltans TaxID=75058 RepID=A0A0S4J0C1_BODSA|nr:Hypothetical protein, putative [Bodo saltans]|eukprot:CUG71919.1 Hypothetical protein, putative [Bodo saltans]